MKTLEYRTVDKSGWQRGPWDDEPDKKQWQDKATGLPCLVVRGGGGALCGYVGVGEGHPYYRQDYDQLYTQLDDVHGGLTFADSCANTDDESRHICHKPEQGEPDHVWWFGFDCSQGGDVRPADNRLEGPSSWGESYKTLAYVERQVTNLARQLAAIVALPEARAEQ